MILILIIYLNKLLFKIGQLNVANGECKLVYVDKNM